MLINKQHQERNTTLADFIHRKSLEEAAKEQEILRTDPARPLRSDRIDLSALPAWRRDPGDIGIDS